MNYTLRDLLDIPKLQELLDTLDEIHSLPSAIIDVEGNILTATAWQDICTKFHRVHPETEKRCRESDTYIVKEIDRKPAHVIYKCPFGLVDTATPIIVEGRHLGNVFTGQLFTAPPDEEQFIRQARQYGFDEKDYLAALKKVPVISEERLHKNLNFLSRFTEMLAEQGLVHKRQLEIEEALRESEQRFKNIVNSSPMGMHLYQLKEDDRLVFIGANPASDQILGVSHKEFIGKTIEVAFPGLVQTEVPARYRDAARNGKTWYTEQIDYHEGLIRGAFEVVAFQTGTNRMVALFHDVTERRQAEEELTRSAEQLELALKGANEGIWDWNIKTGYVSYSDLWVEMIGYKPGELKPDVSTWEQLIHPDDKNKTMEALNKHFEDGQNEYKVEFRLKCKDGSWEWIQALGKVYQRETDGSPLRMAGIHLDITERKNLENQLRQAQKMEAVGHLAGGVAHDFNNILSAIVGYAHITLMKMNDDDPLRMNLEQILAASEKAANLTKSLLAFSRKQVMQMKDVNINNIVSGMTTILERIIGEDILLQVNTPVHDLIIHADANQLEQVLMNLATNARDAMPGGGTLTITTGEFEMDEQYVQMHQTGGAGKYAVLSVADTGTGMDEQTRENIFDPFFTTKEVGKGTGLGLAMIFGTIKQHNGFIHVYSKEGKGTTFKMYFPLTESRVNVTGNQEDGFIPSGTETLLLVEDDEAVRNAIKALLNEFGYSVIEAVDGKQAVKLFRENRDIIELVITDVIMPGQSGKDLYNELLKIMPGIKVIFISGYPANILADKGIVQNDVNLILKPVKPEMLFKKVREVLDA